MTVRKEVERHVEKSVEGANASVGDMDVDAAEACRPRWRRALSAVSGEATSPSTRAPSPPAARTAASGPRPPASPPNERSASR